MTTSRRRGRPAEPARRAKFVTGTATAVAFVGIVASLQSAAASEAATQAHLDLVSSLAARDPQVSAQVETTAIAQVRVAQKAAAKKAAARKRAAEKKKAAAEKKAAAQSVGQAQSAGAGTGYRLPAVAAPRAAAPRPAPRAAAPKPAPRPKAPVHTTSGGSGG